MPLGELENGNTVTAAGAAIGLTNPDINGNYSHNIFTGAGGLDVIDIDSGGEVLSLAVRGKYISAHGVISSVCNRTAASTTSTDVASRVIVPHISTVRLQMHNALSEQAHSIWRSVSRYSIRQITTSGHATIRIARVQMHTSFSTAVITGKVNALRQHPLPIRQALGLHFAQQATAQEFASIHPQIVARIGQQPSLKPNSSNVNVRVQAERVATQGRIRPAYTTSSGYAATDFATGFVNASNLGPVGLAFDQSGNLFVMNYTTGYLYRFGQSGGAASSANQVNSSSIGGAPAGLTFTKDGRLYVALQGGAVDELNPADGTIVRTVAGICSATGIATDPLSGDLFVSGCGGVYRISNVASAAPVVSVYAAIGSDGLSFGPDGTLYNNGIDAISGTNTTTPGAATFIASVSTADGVAVAASDKLNQPPFLLVNRNDGIITKVDLTQNPPVLTNIFSGGSRGDLAIVGPDGCLYATQTDRVIKVTNADGTCSLVPTNHLSYIATIDHSVPLTGVNVLTNTLVPVPLTTTVDAANTHLLWQQTLNRSMPITTETFDSLLPNMRPGEVREVAGGTVISYTGGNAPGTLHLGPLFVTAAHLVALSPPTGTVGLGGQAVYTATLANPTGASLALTPTVAGLPDGWAAPLAPVTLTAGGQVDVPLTITVPTSAAGTGTPGLLGDHPFAVVVADSNGGQDQAGATLTVGDSLGLSLTPGVAAGVDGDVVTYTATITNADAIGQSYALSLSGLEQGAATLPASVTAPAGQAVDVPFTVTVSGPLGPHPFSITATSPMAGGRADAVLDVLGDRRVAATLSPSVAEGGPGVPVLYRLDITNTATLSDTYAFSVSVPDGWSYQVEANGRPVDSLSLLPFVLNAANLSLVVTPASDAAPGDVPISVTVGSLDDPTVRAITPATLTVTERGVQVGLQPKHMTLAPTDSGTWTVAVTNTGSVADTYVLSPTGVIADAARITPSTLSLAPGQTGAAQVTTGPITYGLAQTYGLGVLATSQSDPAIRNADTGDVTFTGYHGVRIGLEPANQTLTDTLQTSYTMLITNTGNLDSYYTFTPHSPAGGPDLTPELSRLEVPAHMTSAILLTAQGHQAGTFSISVRADSTDGTASDTATGMLTIILSPTQTVTPSMTSVSTAMATATATSTATGAATATGTPTSTDTPTSTTTSTDTPTSTTTPSGTATPSPTGTVPPLPSSTPIRTPLPSLTSTLLSAQTPIPSPTSTSTPAPSSTGTAPPPPSPTSTSAMSHTSIPATTATPSPSRTPTNTPTSLPTATPTESIVAGIPYTPAHIEAIPTVTDPGGVLTVTGRGFSPGERIRVAVDGGAGVVTRATADGILPPTGLAVSLDAHPGVHTVVATGLSSGRVARARMTVRPINPTLRLDRHTIVEGGRLCATGAGFLPGESVTVALDSIAVAEVGASTRGGFTTCFTTPSGIVAGLNEASAIGVRSHRPALASVLGALAQGSAFYLAGANTAGGDRTELAVVNPQRVAAPVTLVFYLPSKPSFARTLTVPASTRATIQLDRYVRAVRGFSLLVRSRRVIAAQMIVRRRQNNPYTTLGSGQLSTRWYLAEGYTNLSFHQTLYLLNPGRHPAQVRVHLLPANGRRARLVAVSVPGQRTAALEINHLYEGVSLATLVTSDRSICVERVLTFGDRGFGATGNAGTARAAATWLFAEGATTAGRQTFLTILNPEHGRATVTVVLHDQRGAVVGERTMIVDGQHRGTMRLNDTVHAAALDSTVSSDTPVVVERPYYTDNPNGGKPAASLVYGRNGPGTRWTFPAGDTTHGARNVLLVLNPNPVPVRLRAIFYLSNGHIVTRYVVVAAEARYTLQVNAVAPALDNTLYGVQLSSLNGQGFVAEQSIYDPRYATMYGTAGLAQ